MWRLLILFLILFAGVVSVGQTRADTESQAASSTPEAVVIEQVATSSTESAQEQEIVEASTSTATTTLAASIPTDVQESVNQQEIVEEEVFEEPTETVVSEPVAPAPTKREYKKEIALDSSATHTCTADIFRTDISEQENATVTLVLEKDSGEYELEIGSLPVGIEVLFATNNAYAYKPNGGETEVVLDIARVADAQKGDFTVPVIFNKNQNSSVVCQINIINQ